MTSVIGQECCQDWGSTGLGGVFSVEWICKESLPFQCAHQILNPWNDNKKVQISRDGQVKESPTSCNNLDKVHTTDEIHAKKVIGMLISICVLETVPTLNGQ